MIARIRGFSLIEIMVGLVVGMVCMIVIFKVYSAFEDQKRATTSGGDAQSNGALSLYLLEREIRSAGNGMTEGEPLMYPALAGCLTTVYDRDQAYLIPKVEEDGGEINTESDVADAGTESRIRFAPVIVTDGGDGRSDSITVIYGTSAITAPYSLTSGYAPGAASIALKSTVGIKAGDMVALVEAVSKDAAKYIKPKSPCSLLQVTAGAIPPPGTASDTILVNAADGRHNKAGGVVDQPTYTEEARLYNLGQVNIVTYRIADNSLVADLTKFGVIPDGTASGAPVTNRTDFSPLAANIVNMQIQYGIDTGSPASAAMNCKLNSAGIIIDTGDADGIADEWVDATGTEWKNDGGTSPTPEFLQRIRAVRIGLVARSAVKDLPKPGEAQCSTTTTPITISWGSGPDMTPDLSSDADWRCYRYKIFQTTVPVRNAIWSSTLNPASAASCGVRDM